MKSNKKSGGQLHAVVAIAMLSLSSILCSIPVFCIGILKLFPNLRWKIYCTKMTDVLARIWNDVNNKYIRRIANLRWKIDGLDNLNKNQWYLVVANHQSWLDIVVLQRLFNRKIPVLKFFLKSQLRWIPFLGFSWWAMGFPFMKRYSRAYLEKYPHKRGSDLEATKKAISLFKETPTAVMNFVEGTRYTVEKSKQQQSRYQNLLLPRAGGISYVIGSMGKKFASLLDVTIVYSEKKPSLWDFICRRINAIHVDIRQISIPEEFISPMLVNDKATQEAFRTWINEHWHKKDQLINKMKLEIEKTDQMKLVSI